MDRGSRPTALDTNGGVWRVIERKVPHRDIRPRYVHVSIAYQCVIEDIVVRLEPDPVPVSRTGGSRSAPRVPAVVVILV